MRLIHAIADRLVTRLVPNTTAAGRGDGRCPCNDCWCSTAGKWCCANCDCSKISCTWACTP